MPVESLQRTRRGGVTERFADAVERWAFGVGEMIEYELRRGGAIEMEERKGGGKGDVRVAFGESGLDEVAHFLADGEHALQVRRNALLELAELAQGETRRAESVAADGPEELDLLVMLFEDLGDEGELRGGAWSWS